MFLTAAPNDPRPRRAIHELTDVGVAREFDFIAAYRSRVAGCRDVFSREPGLGDNDSLEFCGIGEIDSNENPDHLFEGHGRFC